jgi:hypothetical protein
VSGPDVPYYRAWPPCQPGSSLSGVEQARTAAKRVPAWRTLNWERADQAARELAGSNRGPSERDSGRMPARHGGRRKSPEPGRHNGREPSSMHRELGSGGRQVGGSEHREAGLAPALRGPAFPGLGGCEEDPRWSAARTVAAASLWPPVSRARNWGTTSWLAARCLAMLLLAEVALGPLKVAGLPGLR